MREYRIGDVVNGTSYFPLTQTSPPSPYHISVCLSSCGLSEEFRMNPIAIQGIVFLQRSYLTLSNVFDPSYHSQHSSSSHSYTTSSHHWKQLQSTHSHTLVVLVQYIYTLCNHLVFFLLVIFCVVASLRCISVLCSGPPWSGFVGQKPIPSDLHFLGVNITSRSFTTTPLQPLVPRFISLLRMMSDIAWRSLWPRGSGRRWRWMSIWGCFQKDTTSHWQSVLKLWPNFTRQKLTEKPGYLAQDYADVVGATNFQCGIGAQCSPSQVSNRIYLDHKR